MRFEVTPANKTDLGSRVYDVHTRYHLIKLLLSEWMDGQRNLDGVCDYLTDEFGIWLDEEITSRTVIEERIAQPVLLSVALDPANADAFFAAVKESVVVKNVTIVAPPAAAIVGSNEDYPHPICPDLP
jgi:hypothetical protein